MLDINLLRKEPQVVRDALIARNDDPALVDRVLEADGRWRDLLAQVEELRASATGPPKKSPASPTRPSGRA
jgi:seryl-tRNA synthetase